MKGRDMTDAAPLGHNNPPEPTVAEQLAANHVERLEAADALIQAAERLPASVALGDDETLAKLVAYVKQCRGHYTVLDDTRDKCKRPFMDLANQVQGFFAPRLAKLNESKQKAERLINDHNQRKETAERQRAMAAAQAMREEADRRAEEAQKLEAQGKTFVAEAIMEHAAEADQMADALDNRAAASSADLARTRTAEGTASSRGDWAFQITDPAALRATLGKLGDFFTAAQLEQAIRSFKAAEKKADRKPELAGVHFAWETKAVIR